MTDEAKNPIEGELIIRPKFGEGVVKWKPEHNEQIIEMGDRGLALAQMAAEFGVSRKTLFNWTKNPKCKGFKKAMEIARARCEAEWIDIGTRGICGQIKGFNQVAWIYSMKCRFREDWQDTNKSEVHLSNDHDNLTDEQLDSLIKRIQTTAKELPTDGSGDEDTIT